MKKKIKGSLMMPLGTLGAAVVIGIFMLWKVIPTFQDMFDQMGNELPGPTQFLVDASQWMVANIVYIFIAAIGIPILIKFLLSRKPIRRAFDGAVRKMPGIGPVIQRSSVATFTRTLGTMISSGVPLMDGLTIVAESISNTAVTEAIMFARARLSEGSTLADPLLVTGVFPNMVVQMIRVGEETGALDTMLNKIADFYDEEVDDAIDMMMALLQPIVMVIMAGVVGGMLIGMYLPIFSMSGSAGA